MSDCQTYDFFSPHTMDHPQIGRSVYAKHRTSTYPDDHRYPQLPWPADSRDTASGADPRPHTGGVTPFDHR